MLISVLIRTYRVETRSSFELDINYSSTFYTAVPNIMYYLYFSRIHPQSSTARSAVAYIARGFVIIFSIFGKATYMLHIRYMPRCVAIVYLYTLGNAHIFYIFDLYIRGSSFSIVYIYSKKFLRKRTNEEYITTHRGRQLRDWLSGARRHKYRRSAIIRLI